MERLRARSRSMPSTTKLITIATTGPQKGPTHTIASGVLGRAFAEKERMVPIPQAPPWKFLVVTGRVAVYLAAHDVSDHPLQSDRVLPIQVGVPDGRERR